MTTTLYGGISGAVTDLVNEIVKCKPDLVLPLPPSDNLRAMRGRRGNWMTNPRVREYKDGIAPLVVKLPKPPVVVLFECFLDHGNRDAQNVAKTLIDAMYSQDKEVCPWRLPSKI